MSDRRSVARKSKPTKPYDDFPLFPTPPGGEPRRLGGNFYYFGPWGDWEGALNEYLRHRDDLYAGGKPRDTSSGVTVADLCNRFLADKELLVAAGELKQRTWDDHFRTCQLVTKKFGRHRDVAGLRPPEDFADLPAIWPSTDTSPRRAR